MQKVSHVCLAIDLVERPHPQLHIAASTTDIHARQIVFVARKVENLLKLELERNNELSTWLTMPSTGGANTQILITADELPENTLTLRTIQLFWVALTSECI